MSTSAAAPMVGEKPDCRRQKRIAELQEEVAIHRVTYDLIMDHPDLKSEKLAKKNWEKLPEKVRHKIITNAVCVDCGATIITDYLMQGDEDGITLYGESIFSAIFISAPEQSWYNYVN